MSSARSTDRDRLAATTARFVTSSTPSSTEGDERFRSGWARLMRERGNRRAVRGAAASCRCRCIHGAGSRAASIRPRIWRPVSTCPSSTRSGGQGNGGADRADRGPAPAQRARRVHDVPAAVAPSTERMLDGQIVVLVDDVRTTGATLDACAQALKGAGAREVRALTVALANDRPHVVRLADLLRATTSISKSLGHSLPSRTARLLAASCAMPFSTASGSSRYPDDIRPRRSIQPMTRPVCGDIRAIRSVCQTFAYTSPRTYSSSLRSRTRSSAVASPLTRRSSRNVSGSRNRN